MGSMQTTEQCNQARQRGLRWVCRVPSGNSCSEANLASLSLLLVEPHLLCVPFWSVVAASRTKLSTTSLIVRLRSSWFTALITPLRASVSPTPAFLVLDTCLLPIYIQRIWAILTSQCELRTYLQSCVNPTHPTTCSNALFHYLCYVPQLTHPSGCLRDHGTYCMCNILYHLALTLTLKKTCTLAAAAGYKVWRLKIGLDMLEGRPAAASVHMKRQKKLILCCSSTAGQCLLPKSVVAACPLLALNIETMGWHESRLAVKSQMGRFCCTIQCTLLSAVVQYWRQRIVAKSVACVAETPHQSVGHEFRHQVVVLILQPPLSSCVVSEACTSYTPACITLTDISLVLLHVW